MIFVPGPLIYAALDFTLALKIEEIEDIAMSDFTMVTIDRDTTSVKDTTFSGSASLSIAIIKQIRVIYLD